MTDTLPITLAGKTYDVPPLPFGLNRTVYPLCRKLSLPGAFVERVTSVGLMPAIEDEDLADLAVIARTCAASVDPALTSEAFDELPVTPPELWAAFLQARYLTGMWSPVGDDAGE